MRFSSFFSTATALLVPFLLSGSGNSATSYKVDAGHSGVSFTILHEQNKVFGLFPNLTGKVELSDDTGSFELSLKADSINTGLAKRDEHLKGNDFFAVSQFPAITFKSTKVTKSAEGYDVVGNLTLHGVTKEISLPLKVTAEAPGMQNATVRGIEGKFTIKRSDYGMKTYLPIVGDEVELWVSLSAQKQ